MPGTDVELILTELLPRLPAGALVQIHDIFLPDAYPEDWAWRGYNEQGAVAAMLTGGGWDILFASRFAQAKFDGRLLGGAGTQIEHLDGMPGGRSDLRNAGAHRSAADDGDDA